MPRSLWSGAISFGLVSVPVRLYPATRSHDVSFHQLNRRTNARVRRERVDAETGEEVAYDDIVKGYDLGGGQYVVVEPEELEALDPEATRTIDIHDFVDLRRIDPVYYDRSYHLAPANDAARKPFKLLADAMRRRGRAAIGTFVMRSNAYLTAIRPHDELLVATTLHYADEVLEPERIDHPDLDDVEVGDRELETAERLIESLEVAWDPERYQDEHQERVLELLQAKAEGEPVPVEAAGQPQGEVIDLMDALERSLVRGRDGAPGPPPGMRDLDELSKQELYDLAQEADVAGRSRMTKDELIEALHDQAA